MIKSAPIFFSILIATAGFIAVAQNSNTPATTGASVEYVTVRFMEERTSIVWPDGSIQNVMDAAGNKKFQGTNEKYPKGSDFRMYWLTTAMNQMAQRGFKVVHMHDNDVVMERLVSR